MYRRGYKRCTKCNKFIKTEKTYCEDCHVKLRCGPRRHFEKRKIWCINCGREAGEMTTNSYWVRIKKDDKLMERIQRRKEASQLYYVGAGGVIEQEPIEGEYDVEKNSRPRFPLCDACASM